MWFRLKKADFSNVDGQPPKNLGTMTALSGSYFITWDVTGGLTKTDCPSYAVYDKETKKATLTATLTLAEGAELSGTPSSTSGTVTHTVSSSTVTVTITNISENCTVTIAATGGSSSGGGGIINYALPYTSWNWVSGFGDALTRTADSFSWSGIESGTAVVLGHKYALSDTPFKIGDTVYFGIRNLVKEGGNFSLCFFKADNTEIIPRLNGTITSPISYLTKEVPAETTRIEIRLHGSAMPSCSGGKAYLSTVPFDENTVWAN